MEKNSYKENFFQKIKGSLFVSCQAYEGEPFFSPDSMARMALCAMQGGAKGIRANSIPQIKAIMKAVMAQAGMQTEARSVAFSLPVSDIAGLRLLETELT